MNTYKKIISGFIISSLFIGNFSFSYANNTTLTKEEKTKIEAEILKLQSNIFAKSKNYLENLSKEFNKLTSYEETGNLKFEFLIDENMFGKIDANFEIKNYNLKNKNLDSDLSGNFSLNTKFTPIYGSGFELDISSFLSLISKDSQIYTLLKDFDFKVSNENISKLLEEIKKQFSDNKYIKLPTDEKSQLAYNLIKNFSLNKSLTETEKKLSKPLLEAYKKSGNKYLLVPTKYACETYFELERNFAKLLNPGYTPRTCSDLVYKSFVKDFINFGEFYLILDKENTLGFYLKEDNLVIDFSVKYNKQNNFIEINSSVKSTNLTGNLTLKNKKLSGFYIYKEMGYDYTDWQNPKYKLKNVYGVKITGSTSSNNILEKLNIQFAGVDLKTKKAFLVGKTGFNKGAINYNLKTQNDFLNLNISGKGEAKNNYFKLNSKIDLIQNSYDYFTNSSKEKKYNGKLNLLIDSTDSKNNSNIEFILNDERKQILKMKILNNGKRVYKEDIKIETPTDFKEFDIEKISEAMYGE